ncbi:MAG: tetratricopeptide repeat protein, partial [Anaerolineae bacterium]
SVYYQQGRYDAAIAAYQQAVALDPKFASPHNNLGSCFMQRHTLDQASLHYRERIRLSSQDALSARVCLAVIGCHLGQEGWKMQCQQASTVWDHAWRVGLQSKAGLLENKALVHLMLGETDEALKLLGQAIAVRLPGDQIELIRYELLAEAAQPPVGVQACIELLSEADKEQLK